MALLCGAKLLVASVPFERWRGSLGPSDKMRPDVGSDEARRLAAHVRRAASLLPFTIECLPQAMALSWMLRRRSISHSMVIAVRPEGMRGGPDGLHAWVDVDGARILGDLPGQWVETLRLGPRAE